MTVIAIIVLALLAWSVLSRYGAFHPGFLMSAVWWVTFVVSATTGNALGLDHPSAWTIAIILLCVSAFSVAPLVAPASHEAPRLITWNSGRLLVATCVVSSSSLRERQHICRGSRRARGLPIRT